MWRRLSAHAPDLGGVGELWKRTRTGSFARCPLVLLRAAVASPSPPWRLLPPRHLHSVLRPARPAHRSRLPRLSHRPTPAPTWDLAGAGVELRLGKQDASPREEEGRELMGESGLRFAWLDDGGRDSSVLWCCLRGAGLSSGAAGLGSLLALLDRTLSLVDQTLSLVAGLSRRRLREDCSTCPGRLSCCRLGAKQRGSALARFPDSHEKQLTLASSATPIHRLPTEVLSHVFAHLPPTSLADAQLVCCEWRDVIADEASWRVRPFQSRPLRR